MSDRRAAAASDRDQCAASDLVDRAAGPAGSAGRPRPARRRPASARTPSRWNGSPEWLAPRARAARRSRSSPPRSIPTACSGLLDERGKIGGVRVARREHPAPSARQRDAALPRWWPSTKPERRPRRAATARVVSRGPRGIVSWRTISWGALREQVVDGGVAVAVAAGDLGGARVHARSARAARSAEMACSNSSSRPSDSRSSSSVWPSTSETPTSAMSCSTEPAVLVDPGRLDPQVPAEAVVAARRVGEDGGQVRRRSCRPPPAAAGQLGPQDVHPALEQPPEVGQVGLLLLGLVAAAARSSSRSRSASSLDEALGQHLVDAAAAVRVRARPVVVIGLVAAAHGPAVLDAQQHARLVGGHRRPLDEPGQLGRPRDQLRVVAHRAAPARRSGCPPCRPAGARPRDSAANATGSEVRPTPVADQARRRAAPRPRRRAPPWCRACRRGRPSPGRSARGRRRARRTCRAAGSARSTWPRSNSSNSGTTSAAWVRW